MVAWDFREDRLTIRRGTALGWLSRRGAVDRLELAQEKRASESRGP